MVFNFRILLSTALILGSLPHCFSQPKIDHLFLKQAEGEIVQLMDKGDIPGLSIVMIDHDDVVIRSFGYADLERRIPVTSRTLFEIGSCTKAFTALAITNLEAEGKINLDRNVSAYLPWFYTTFEDSVVDITLRQLLHHTSGIPWGTISRIPSTDAGDALEKTVRTVVGQELDNLPGKEFQYATVHYDILALVAETVTKQPFETYLANTVIEALGLSSTSIGVPKHPELMSTGYKSGFFSPHPYNAPVYRGNNAAGYIITNAADVAVWLRFQMGLGTHSLHRMAAMTHQRDEHVALHNMSSYARGWEVALDGTGEIYHGGLNPNFSAYITFRAGGKIGVAVLANASSNFTRAIGNKVMKMLAHEKVEREYDPGDRGDRAFSLTSIALGSVILALLIYGGSVVKDIAGQKRNFETFTLSKGLQFGKALLFVLPFLYGIYLLPHGLAGFTWEALLIWQPFSLGVLLVLLSTTIVIGYVLFLANLIFPEKNELKKKIPAVLLLTILSGLSNVLLIVLVTSAVDSDVKIKYLVFYYALIISLYLLGRRHVQISLIRITRGIVYDLRIRLVNKIFSTSYDNFETIDRGKVYTVLNDDVSVIGKSTNLFVSLATSFITVMGAFLYLASMAFWATLLTTFLVVFISALYYWVSQRTNIFFEDARDSRNVFMRLLSGMIDGYKEISLHHRKKVEYQNEVREIANEYRAKMTIADIEFTNAFLVGESLLVVLLGCVSIGMAELFPNIEYGTITSFIIVLLYLIGPVNFILSSIPELMSLRIAWDRVHKFIRNIPAHAQQEKLPEELPSVAYKLEARAIQFRYESGGFSVGPIDLEVCQGEILFITGGNGSGKTTLAKMLTGLYQPDNGHVLINGEVMDNSRLSECFSAIFNPPYLFERLYAVDLENRGEDVDQYLKLLDLSHVVEVKGNRYSTINLSSGQRKRLALMQCYLEDRPIYLFDEWAADQDPEYRRFFYRTLLPRMKQAGKIVIAITHDDHYFDLADKILKLDRGQLDLTTGRGTIRSGLNIQSA